MGRLLVAHHHPLMGLHLLTIDGLFRAPLPFFAATAGIFGASCRALKATNGEPMYAPATGLRYVCLAPSLSLVLRVCVQGWSYLFSRPFAPAFNNPAFRRWNVCGGQNTFAFRDSFHQTMTPHAWSGIGSCGRYDLFHCGGLHRAIFLLPRKPWLDCSRSLDIHSC